MEEFDNTRGIPPALLFSVSLYSDTAVKRKKKKEKKNHLLEACLAAVQLTSAVKETGADSGLPHINKPTLTEDTLQHLITAQECFLLSVLAVQ